MHTDLRGYCQRSLKRIGPIVGRISDILIRIGKEVEDEGPLPEMQRLGEKLEERGKSRPLRPFANP